MLEFDLNELNTFEFDTQLDSNGDGMADYFETNLDTTGDGFADSAVVAYDSNHSGVVDTVIVYHDTTGDGNVDTVAKMFDYDQDGHIDSMTLHQDLNGDGQYEQLSKLYDSTGDGQIDTVDVYFDSEGTGHASDHQVYAYDPASGELIPAAAAGFEVSGTYIWDLDNFDPATVTDPDAISGDPAASMKVWECQGQTNRCALYSEKFVIEELTGADIDIEDFADVAKEHGWFTEDGGTTFLNMNNMLDYYGIENEMSFHNNIEDIENCLNDGGKVIVSIDSDEIWMGKENNIFSPNSGANHAVEVIGVDRTDPDNPMVILNDSGSPYGKGEMVPLDVFEGAWEEGNCQMIECYKA